MMISNVTNNDKSVNILANTEYYDEQLQLAPNNNKLKISEKVFNFWCWLHKPTDCCECWWAIGMIFLPKTRCSNSPSTASLIVN